MRCLALAQAWQDSGNDAVFVTRPGAPALEDRLRAEDMAVEVLPHQSGTSDDVSFTREAAQRANASWIVVDGYHFEAAYLSGVKSSGCKILLLDDNAESPCEHADLVLNQNIHACEGLYANRHSEARFLLGTQYTLLRREFLKWRGWQRTIEPQGRRVLVTLGGSDPDNVTSRVLHALQQTDVPHLEVQVVVGPANPHLSALQRETAQWPDVRLLMAVADMAPLMAWADVAITAAGSSCWELAFMGLPSLLLVTAANQEKAAENLAERQVFLHLGQGCTANVSDMSRGLQGLLKDEELRRRMSQAGRELIDGQGAQRVLGAIHDMEKSHGFAA